MIVDDSLSLTEKVDYYTTDEHEMMDYEVGVRLKKANTLWPEDPSEPELRFSFRQVVEGDVRLDRKFLDKNFPKTLETMLSEAWQAMSFRSVHILRTRVHCSTGWLYSSSSVSDSIIVFCRLPHPVPSARVALEGQLLSPPFTPS